jgi:Lrp/AsnC family transcriptional regulator for asnA, asnC and gidA
MEVNLIDYRKDPKMTQIELDDVDKRIMEALQLDGRASFAELSRKLDVAEATVRFRVKRLIDKGVITRFAVLLDPAKVGFGVSGAILLKIDPAYLEEACRQMVSFDETLYLFQSTGEYDVVSVILARDMAHLNDLVKKTKMILGVKDARVSVTTRFLKFDPAIKF